MSSQYARAVKMIQKLPFMPSIAVRHTACGSARPSAVLSPITKVPGCPKEAQSCPACNSTSNASWQSSLRDQLKLNVGTFVVYGLGKIGLGAIIRDHDGKVRGAMSKVLSSHFVPTTAELFAICEGLQFSNDKVSSPPLWQVTHFVPS